MSPKIPPQTKMKDSADNLHSSSQEQTRTNVRQIFTEYLKVNGYRKTPERYAILDKIYSNDGHFDIDTLYSYMSNKNYRVSRATLYNTVELLLDCKLLVKHQFGTHMAQYERAFSITPHDHLICTCCGKVTEQKRKKTDTGDITSQFDDLKFKIDHYSLYIYGMCDKCQKKTTKE